MRYRLFRWALTDQISQFIGMAPHLGCIGLAPFPLLIEIPRFIREETVLSIWPWLPMMIG